MPTLTLAISDEGLARLKRRAEQAHVKTVRAYCIWLLANDAAKAASEPDSEPEPEPQAA